VEECAVLTRARVDHVEAHGTGTPLGDPIEAGALAAVLGAGRDPEQPLLLGSVKGNLGHLESASGIAGLVKTVLALQHDLVPPSLHCLAEGSSLDDVRLRVVTEPEPWPRYGGTATAGVSGFGFGGTNAHAVLEEWRPGALLPPPAGAPTARLHVLSDVGPARLRDTAARLADWLGTPEGDATHLADVARTLAGRAGRGPLRAAIVARDRNELADGLRALSQGRPRTQVVTGDRDLVGEGPVWVFSGYGSQWVGMGRRLLAEEPAFATAVEKLDGQLAPECGLSLHDHLASGGPLDRLEVAQPVLFGLQLALAELWRAYGVEPVAVIGHSLGEVAAAVCAGALDVSDAARVVAVRARLLSGLRGGAMAVTDLADDELAALARDFPGVHVAVHSSPTQKVVTGEEAAVARLVRSLEREGRAVRAMRVTGAGHSPQVDPLLPELTDALADIRGGRPRIPVHSTVLDDPRGDCRFDAAHWAANLRRPVRLDRAVASAADDGHTAFVEISPHPVLTGALTDIAPGALAVGSLHRDADGSAGFLTRLATLHTAGRRLPLPPGRVADLPGPRWRHVRHWWTDGRGGSGTAASSGGPAVVTTPTTISGGTEEVRGGMAIRADEEARGADDVACCGARAIRACEGSQDTDEATDARAIRVGEEAQGTDEGGGARAIRVGGGTWGADEVGGAVEVWGAEGGSVVARLCHHIAVVTGHPPARVTPATAFADLGLDSLMAVRIRAGLQRDFGRELPLRDLLGAATVEETAARVRQALAEAGPTPEPTLTGVPTPPTAEGPRLCAPGAPEAPRQAAPAAPRPTPRPTAQPALPAPPSALETPPASALSTSQPTPQTTPRPAAAAATPTPPVVPAAAGRPRPASAAGRRFPSLTRPTLVAGVPVRALHGAGSRSPLFLVHAAGGTTDVYRGLAERLGAVRPVYGLERIEEARTVVEKARRYVEAVTAVQPDGPCLLGGWSFGGFVAQEAARQLTAAGRDVGPVALIDSVRPLPEPLGQTPADRVRSHFTGFARHVAETYGVRLRLPYDALAATDDDGERVETVLRALRESADVPAAALEHQRASYLDLRIGEAHRPGRHDGPVVLYRATEPAPHTVRDPAYERDDEALGWDEVCPRLTVVRVAGHHLSLLDPPYVDEIAAHLRRELDEETR
jgi:phthiocerol/phenolphthiocerol synthesis type-I polyketide synthase A